MLDRPESDRLAVGGQGLPRNGRKGRFLAATIGVAAVVASSMTVSGGAANAEVQSESANPTVRAVHIDGAALRAQAKTAAQLNAELGVQKGAREGQLAKRQQRIKESLDDAARNGRLVDERNMHVASVPDPFTAGAEIQVVWDGEKAPESLSYHRKDFGGGMLASVAMGVQFGGGDGSGATETKSVPSAQAGSGYSAGFDLKNMRLGDHNCADTWFRPAYPSNRDHKLNSCFEVFEQDRTVHFVYNRYTLWTPAPATQGYRAFTKDLYVASRPWKGKEGNFNKLRRWIPEKPSQRCDTKATMNIGGTYAGVTGEVSVPMNVCENYWLDITTTRSKMGIDFDGSREGQMFMDVAGSFEAINATVMLTWADYNWVELQACTSPQLGGCNPSEKWVAKDSGW